MVSDEMIEHFNLTYRGVDVPEIIETAWLTFGTLAMTTAFGCSGIVLLSFLKESCMNDIPIYFVDTQFHFCETIRLEVVARRKWGLSNVRYLTSRFSEKELTEFGAEPETNQNLCCLYRKTAPLLQVLPRHAVWLTSLRRDQTQARAGLKLMQVDGRGTVQINPLYDWSLERIWAYIGEHGLPYNPLYDQGYPSVGCMPCTRPVAEGGDTRDGRWPGARKKECGMHAL